LGINKWTRISVRNVWAVGEFWQSCSSIPNWCCCNLFFLQSHYIGMLQSQSSSFTSGCNRWRQLCCITSCTVGGSTRNGLTPICSCGEMAALRMTKTPKNIGRKFWVQSILIFGLLIYRVVIPIRWTATFSNGGVNEKDVIIIHKWGRLMIWRSHWRLLRRGCNQ